MFDGVLNRHGRITPKVPDWVKQDEARLASIESVNSESMTVQQRGEKLFLKIRLQKYKDGVYK